MAHQPAIANGGVETQLAGFSFSCAEWNLTKAKTSRKGNGAIERKVER
jgi:hypothetical protein